MVNELVSESANLEAEFSLVKESTAIKEYRLALKNKVLESVTSGTYERYTV